ncbi:ATPase, T2SS/T4P/T4SS family [Stieleria varia]|uniref:Type II secretion system protein E n=1 Tax=Stieleria varia TaxID=2528005 RepID=A0A5C6A1T0_9BACT|nr:ATPase, T2SS/T4P/T4SS family [Stieleria varia]TWT93812.1 Type II secretion system protein E [Stieleria varia]
MAEQPQPTQLWQTVPPVEFTPKLSDNTQVQALLINARQGIGFAIAAGQVSHGIHSRATHLLLDFTAQGCAVRYQIDGQWEQLPPLDRESGDAMLYALKQLTLLNPADRRSAQAGSVKVKLAKAKFNLTLQSQGVPTGERVLLKIDSENVPFERLGDLGMRDKMIETFKQTIDGEGNIVLITAPTTEGLTTTWNVAIQAADRLVRDFQSFEPKGSPEPEIININPNFYGGDTGLTLADSVRKAILKEPDVFMFPTLPDPEIMGTVLKQVSTHEKQAILRMNAGGAIEGVARLMAQYPEQKSAIASTLGCVLGQRLVRRLCDNCKLGFQPPPQLLQQLGIPPGRVTMMYQPFVPPPIEQQVDEQGRPAPITPCHVCQGRGYMGRTAIFELLTPGEKFRDAMQKTQDMGQLTAIARSEGFRPVQTEAVLTVARGLTSLDELKRAFSR